MPKLLSNACDLFKGFRRRFSLSQKSLSASRSLFISSYLFIFLLPLQLNAETLEVLEIRHGVTWSIKTEVAPIKTGGKNPKPAVLTVGSVMEDGAQQTMRTLLLFDFSDLSKTVGNRNFEIKSASLTLSNWGPKENGSEIPVQLHLLGDGGPNYKFSAREVDWSSAPAEPGGTIGALLSAGNGISRIFDETEFPSSPAFVQAVQEAMNARQALHLILVAENEKEESFAAFFGQIIAGRGNPKPKLTIEYIYTE